MVTREQAVAALFAALTATGAFKTTGRRNRKPDAFTPATTPALLLLDHSDGYRNPSTRQPSIRSMAMRAILYSDVGTDENAIPAAIINDLLDVVDAALARDPASGKCTLGGLVDDVMIDGAIIKAPGEVTGKNLAVVPITIILP